MVDLPELLTLIAELTALLRASQSLYDLAVTHNAKVGHIQARLDAPPTQC